MDAAANQRFQRAIPAGDSLERLVCQDCGWVHYENPKVVVGAVVTHQGRYLLCRRAIEPRVGYWTMPAGFMELGETAAEGAVREALEEANARVAVDALLGVYSVPRIGQVHMIFRATLIDVRVAPGPESLELGWYAFAEIPWTDLAFPSVHWALRHHSQVAGRREFAPFSTPPEYLGG